MSRRLRIGYAQTLGLRVTVAKDYLRHAVRQTVFEGSGREWSDKQAMHHISEELPEKARRLGVIYATDNGSPVGCIFFGFQGNAAPWIPMDEEYDKIFIDTLFVEPEYRRRGIAKLLLKMAVREHCSASGSVCLNADAGNEKAMNLYRSLGFKSFAFVHAKSTPIKTIEELHRKHEGVKTAFGKKTVSTKQIDLLNDRMILQFHRQGLQNISRAQHIYAIDEDEILPTGMKWRREYYGVKPDYGCYQINNALPILTALSGYKNVGIYIDRKLVGFYSLLESSRELVYLCIFPTDDDTSVNIARYAIYDSMIQMLPWQKEHKHSGEYSIAFRPLFHFCYLCLTDRERQFWQDEGFTIRALAMLGNRKTIENRTTLTPAQLEALPTDIQLCHAVVSGTKPANIPADMTADDWRYLLSGIQRERHFWAGEVCKDLSVFDNNTLVALFAAREIDECALFANVRTSGLTAENWAEIIWNNHDCIPKCPAKMWKRFTSALWEKIMANNTFKGWHFGTLEELTADLCDDKIKAFFKRHPTYASKFPIGNAFRYQVPSLRILGEAEIDKAGQEYPEYLKIHDLTNEYWGAMTNLDDEEADSGEFN